MMRRNIPDEVSEFSVAGTHFDRQPHTHHSFVNEQKQVVSKIFMVSLMTIFDQMNCRRYIEKSSSTQAHPRGLFSFGNLLPSYNQEAPASDVKIIFL